MINYFNIFGFNLLNNLSGMQEFWWKFSFYFLKIFWWGNIVEEKNVTYFWHVKYTLHVIYFLHVTYFLHRCEMCCITKNFFDVQWFSYQKKFEKSWAFFKLFQKPVWRWVSGESAGFLNGLGISKKCAFFEFLMFGCCLIYMWQ